jgi:hypothetical protein
VNLQLASRAEKRELYRACPHRPACSGIAAAWPGYREGDFREKQLPRHDHGCFSSVAASVAMARAFPITFMSMVTAAQGRRHRFERACRCPRTT